MKLDGNLFPPLFREVRRVQETMWQYCIAGDSIPVQRDNLQFAIEQMYGVVIEPRFVPLGSRLLRGLIEIYPDKSIIYIDGELNSAWRHYVFAKEACHHLLDGENYYTLEPIKVIEAIVVEENEIDGEPSSSLDVQAEMLTKFAAIELLFPLEFRIECQADVKNGDRSTYEIAESFDIPEHLVQYALTDRYMDYSRHIWSQLD